MKMNLAIVLLCSMLLAYMASCGADTTNEDVESQTNDSVATETETVKETTLIDTLAVQDYEGYTFQIVSAETGGTWLVSIDAEESTGEIINDTVYERNLAVEERYNIIIQNNVMQADAITKVVKENVQANSDEYDMISNWVKLVLESAPNGYYYNLHAVDSIDFTKPYWDEKCIDPLTIQNRLYIAFNSLNIQALDLSTCTFFNNDMVIEYGFENPYTLVREGRWTMDAFIEMAEDVLLDCNGDGVMDKEDQYGCSAGIGSFNPLTVAAGCPHIIKDENEKFILNYGSEQSINAAEKIAAIVNADFALYANEQPWAYEVFDEGRALFSLAGLAKFSSYRTLEIDLGILPMPKYNEAQERYYSMMSNCSMGVTIPASATEPERTGVILEAMGAYSIGTLDTAYYDTVLLGKYARNEDSVEMINLIKDTLAMDIGVFNENAYGSIITSWLNNMRSKGAEGIASLAASNQTKFETLIEKMETAYAKLP